MIGYLIIGFIAGLIAGANAAMLVIGMMIAAKTDTEEFLYDNKKREIEAW
jgi:hypothetical protein